MKKHKITDREIISGKPLFAYALQISEYNNKYYSFFAKMKWQPVNFAWKPLFSYSSSGLVIIKLTFFFLVEHTSFKLRFVHWLIPHLRRIHDESFSMLFWLICRLMFNTKSDSNRGSFLNFSLKLKSRYIKRLWNIYKCTNSLLKA